MDKQGDQWVIGVRVSSEEQAKPGHVSLAGQEATCRKYIVANGGETAEVVSYTGSGLTAAPFYKKIQAAIGRTGATHVIVWRFDRFGREHLDAMLVCRELERSGVEVVSATEPTYTPYTRDEEFMQANKESRKISVRVTAAMPLRAADGWWLTGAPFGYRVVKVLDEKGETVLGSTLEPDKNAPAVRELFRLAAAGEPTATLLDFAAAHGLRAARDKEGRTLSRASIRYILGNPAYVGKVAWGRVGHGKFTKTGKRAEADIVLVDGRHEGLIDLDTWKTVQGLLAGRRTGHYRGKRSGGTLLDGLMICGACGARIRCHAHRVRGKLYRQLYCSAHRDRGTCQQGSLSADAIEAQVKAEIEQGVAGLLSRPDFLARIKALRQHREDAGASTEALRKNLLEQREKIEGQRYKLLDMELAGRCTPAEADRQRTEYDESIAGIATQLEALSESPPDITPIVDQLEQAALEVRDAWASRRGGRADTPEEKEEADKAYEAAVGRLTLALDDDPTLWRAVIRILVSWIELVGTVKDGHVIIVWTDAAKVLLHETDIVSRMIQLSRLVKQARPPAPPQVAP
jgi:site-specific DNA recombinase